MNVIIRFEKVSFGYAGGDALVFDGLELDIKKGEYLALMGPNGSGKTTLAMLLKGIHSPLSGRIYYRGEDVTGKGINRNVGYLFSNTEDQIIYSVVEEDVAFGPENQGLCSKDIRSAIDKGMSMCGTTHLRHGLTHLLSGGEQQKVLISGLLAMNGDCIIFDEAISMLDPAGRREAVTLLSELSSEKGLTVIHVTHSLEELMLADRVITLNGGRVVFEGSPGQLFDDNEMIEYLGFKSKGFFKLMSGLRKEGIVALKDRRGVESLAEGVLNHKKRPA